MQSLLWFIPCLFIILADLSAGIKAAKYRGETVRPSTAWRRTGNKIFCYLSWIIACVALNERYDTSLCAFIGIGLILAIETTSFIGNLLEPHGLVLSIHGLLKVVGKKHNLEGLEGVIEKSDDKKEEAPKA